MGRSQLQLLYNDARLATLLDALDTLHTAASEDALDGVTTLSKAELMGWLCEIVYTAQETMTELQSGDGADVTLTLLQKSS